MATQFSLFGREPTQRGELDFGGRRIELAHDAWVEHHPGWLRAHAWLFERLVHDVTWHETERVMYQKNVQVPRLLASAKHAPPLPIFGAMRAALDERYGASFERLSLAWYRDGRDGVAYHGDTTARDLPTALVATVSLGAPRRCLLRPTEGGDSIAFELGFGDLFVMGGTCQRTWRHAIPKAARADARIALMYRCNYERVMVPLVAPR